MTFTGSSEASCSLPYTSKKAHFSFTVKKKLAHQQIQEDVVNSAESTSEGQGDANTDAVSQLQLAGADHAKVDQRLGQRGQDDNSEEDHE